MGAAVPDGACPPSGVPGAAAGAGEGSGSVGAATASQSSRVGRVKLYSSSSSMYAVPEPSRAVNSSRPSMVSPHATSAERSTTVSPGARTASASPDGVRVVASRTA